MPPPAPVALVRPQRRLGRAGTAARLAVGSVLIVRGRDDQIGCPLFEPVDALDRLTGSNRISAAGR